MFIVKRSSAYRKTPEDGVGDLVRLDFKVNFIDDPGLIIPTSSKPSQRDKTIRKARKIAEKALSKSDCAKLFEIPAWDNRTAQFVPKDSRPADFLADTDILFRAQDADVLKANPGTSWIGNAVIDANNPFYKADGERYRLGKTILLSEAAIDVRPNVPFNDAVSAARVPQLDDDQLRALAILHELMHLIFKQGHNSSNSEGSWNDNILKNCF